MIKRRSAGSSSTSTDLFIFYLFLLYFCELGMPFEFDPTKSAANKAKCGIDFEEAQELWGDMAGIVVQAKKTTGEVRFARIAKYKGKVWFCVYTIRGSTIRIITTRRARQYEEAYYAKND
jgi:uncharacterized DUF497 family protein